MKRPGLIAGISVLLAFSAGVIGGVGCRPVGSTVLGTPPTGTPAKVAEILAANTTGLTNTAVTLEGVMVEKCPVAGCWFKLRDGANVLRVDTKFAGFVVLDVPLNSQVTVSGRVAADGSERVLVASGLRY